MKNYLNQFFQHTISISNSNCSKFKHCGIAMSQHSQNEVEKSARYREALAPQMLSLHVGYHDHNQLHTFIILSPSATLNIIEWWALPVSLQTILAPLYRMYAQIKHLTTRLLSFASHQLRLQIFVKVFTADIYDQRASVKINSVLWSRYLQTITKRQQKPPCRCLKTYSTPCPEKMDPLNISK